MAHGYATAGYKSVCKIREIERLTENKEGLIFFTVLAFVDNHFAGGYVGWFGKQ